MNKLAFLLVTSSLLTFACAQEINKMQTATVRLTISGTIKNFDEFAALVEPETCIQLIPLPADGRVGGTTDSKGRWAYNSDLPKLPIPKKAAFSFVVPNTQPGRYFLAAQRLKAGAYHPEFVTDKRKHFIIDVPADAKSAFTIDAGDLIVWTH
jgi:hypothetical protein